MRKLLFASASLLFLLTISGLGACNRFEEVGDKYIVTNKRGRRDAAGYVLRARI